MPAATHPVIVSWARSAVVPRNGAFKALHAHDIAAPVVQALLQRAGLAATHVNALIAGNALGAGGNPARMLLLHAGLPTQCAAFTIDTQCCAGLDAVRVAAAMIASGQADVVVAGGMEAWSRSPIRMHRPSDASTPAVAYERPAFAPDPLRDPDMLVSAARYAAQHGYSRVQQDDYAVQSHQRALKHQHQVQPEIVPIHATAHDTYPRAFDAARAARMPAIRHATPLETPNTLSPLAVSPQADGAAFVLLASEQACTRLKLRPQAAWLASSSVGCAPEMPLVGAELAARAALAQVPQLDASALAFVELHDAFAVQGLSFCQGLGLAATQLNPHGGGLARGHPIGASGAIALVRLLQDLSSDAQAGAYGLAAIAGAGGLGSAALVRKI